MFGNCKCTNWGFCTCSPRIPKLPETPKLDLTKPVQTRSGLPVRILCTNGPTKETPVLGYIAVETQAVSNCVRGWTSDGGFLSWPEYSLVNVPPEVVSITRTVSFARNQSGELYAIIEPDRISKVNQCLGKATITIKQGDGI